MLVPRYDEHGPDIHGLAMSVRPVRAADMLKTVRQNADDPE
jgi:hypothetical protein